MVDQAAAPLLAALKTSPDNHATIVKVANLYYDGRQFPEAIQYYRRAVNIQPHNADVLTDLGTSLWYTGDADEAIAQFRASVEVSPRFSRNAIQPGRGSLARKNGPPRCDPGLGGGARPESKLPSETADRRVYRKSERARQRLRTSLLTSRPADSLSSPNSGIGAHSSSAIPAASSSPRSSPNFFNL
jgi:tetratricopeptide (TPR) repeat protein